MLGNVSLSPRQRKLLSLLWQGSTIVDAAKEVGITEMTAHRWLKQPLVQAECEQHDAALRKAEQAEIDRTLTSGYALMHKRVEALDRMVHEIEASYHDAKTGEIIYQWMSPDKIKEWRGCLDDIARELGQRIKKQEIAASVDISGAKDRLFAKVAAFAKPTDTDATQSE